MVQCRTISNLQDEGFIAGNRQIFDFQCFDENGLPLDISDSLTEVRISPYGDTSYTTLIKSGVNYDTNKFSLILEEADTINLSGLYSFQVIITDALSKKFRPAQGTWFIQPAIK